MNQILKLSITHCRRSVGVGNSFWWQLFAWHHHCPFLPNCLLFEHISAPLLMLSISVVHFFSTVQRWSHSCCWLRWKHVKWTFYLREKWKDGEWNWTWNRFWYHRAGGQRWLLWVRNWIRLLIDLTQDRPHTVDPKPRTPSSHPTVSNRMIFIPFTLPFQVVYYQLRRSNGCWRECRELALKF